MKRIGIAFLIIIVAGGLFGYYWFYSLERDHRITRALITGFYWSGGRSARSYEATYSFKVGKKNYNDNAPIACENFNLSNLNNKLSGKYLLVVYHSNYPANNYLLVTKSDYQKFHIAMPDSLKWIDDFLKCQ